MGTTESNIEWLQQVFETILTHEQKRQVCGLFEQAKEMHKQEIENAFVECWKANMPDGYECKLSAEQYYNETFVKI
jgi:hypothetical protein